MEMESKQVRECHRERKTLVPFSQYSLIVTSIFEPQNQGIIQHFSSSVQKLRRVVVNSYSDIDLGRSFPWNEHSIGRGHCHPRLAQRILRNKMGETT